MAASKSVGLFNRRASIDSGTVDACEETKLTSDNQTQELADMLSLRGQGFVVLGAGQGMGEQTAIALCQQGANVLCVDLNASAAERVAAACDGHCMAADVTVRADMRKVFDEARKLFGESLRGVVDIVGMVHAKDITDMEDADWDRQFGLVFKHAYLAIQYAAPLIAANGGGSMVFIGSIAGLGVRTGRMLPYATAKAALNQLVRGSAKQWAAAGVRMNVVAPGLTRTPRLVDANGPEFWAAQGGEIPMGRPGEISDVIASVLFYSSGMSRHVTGTVLAIDGGAHLLGESSYVPKPNRQ
ncbi:SDR family NAD(P)-dependent oxidoreductase [Caenimonas soli]|uniref:SDR family NAD(P)-dependent oxidoreductase n=1 Tax=Caenimonas soli TaxID=2735555 RepID=UPI00155812F6|nr:SDR family oxidoreductase [Caenimonas soli]NPC58289.1 SDR family oxidoreductase [Caenimonas soli]